MGFCLRARAMKTLPMFKLMFALKVGSFFRYKKKDLAELHLTKGRNSVLICTVKFTRFLISFIQFFNALEAYELFSISVVTIAAADVIS
jgi:hypothetical protein